MKEKKKNTKININQVKVIVILIIINKMNSHKDKVKSLKVGEKYSYKEETGGRQALFIFIYQIRCKRN